MVRLVLCTNCLDNGGQDRAIGHGDQQRDSQQTISLCAVCWEALHKGDLKTFSQRYRESREVSR